MLENETKTVYDFIKKNRNKFFSIKNQIELELRVRAYNDIIGLDDYEDADEGIEWVCFGELYEEVKKLYNEEDGHPTMHKKEFEEWKKRMTNFGCEIVKFEDKNNKTIFRPIRDKEAKEKGMYIVDRVVRKYGGKMWNPEMYIAMKKTDLFDMDKE